MIALSLICVSLNRYVQKSIIALNSTGMCCYIATISLAYSRS